MVLQNLPALPLAGSHERDSFTKENESGGQDEDYGYDKGSETDQEVESDQDAAETCEGDAEDSEET